MKRDEKGRGREEKSGVVGKGVGLKWVRGKS
jgi:hypothetical protein